MLKIDEHESRLSELIQFLNVEGVDQSKVSLIIQGLRDNYTEVNTTFTENNTKLEKNAEMMEGLRSANMQLLSSLGTQLSDITKRDKQPPTEAQPSQDDVQSLDDIALEFLK